MKQLITLITGVFTTFARVCRSPFASLRSWKLNVRSSMFAFALSLALTAPAAPSTLAEYFAPAGRTNIMSGGVRMIPVQTPKGTFKVWTKRVGNNPKIKVLLLHGGPGGTHEYLEACDSFLPAAGIEYYYYDQLGSAYSDQPDEPSLWDTDRFVDEVEQVRQALGLTRDNFYLFGQSWGGILAIEYALKHQQHLKGLVIANMMSSVPAYNDYAKKTLMPAMPPEVLQEVLRLEAAKDFDNPRYMDLLMPHFYVKHLLRMPPDQWPDPVMRSFAHMNKKIYVPMQGPSEMGIIPGTKLEKWDRSADLSKITVPTLVIGAQHDTMDPEHMKWMSEQLPKGSYLHCANGSHLALYDDQQTFFSGLVKFLKSQEPEEKKPAASRTPATTANATTAFQFNGGHLYDFVRELRRQYGTNDTRLIELPREHELLPIPRMHMEAPQGQRLTDVLSLYNQISSVNGNNIGLWITVPHDEGTMKRPPPIQAIIFRPPDGPRSESFTRVIPVPDLAQEDKAQLEKLIQEEVEEQTFRLAEVGIARGSIGITRFRNGLIIIRGEKPYVELASALAEAQLKILAKRSKEK